MGQCIGGWMEWMSVWVCEFGKFWEFGEFRVVQMSNITNGTSLTREIQMLKVKCQKKFKIKKIKS